jgi:hypothetical protein
MSDTPARLKNELDSVLTLQGDLNTVNRTIQNARATLAKSAPTNNSISHLIAKVEDLYASLNVHDLFPELDGINFNFV